MTTNPTTTLQHPSRRNRNHPRRGNKRRNKTHSYHSHLHDQQAQEKDQAQRVQEDIDMTTGSTASNMSSDEIMRESEVSSELTHLDTIEKQVQVVEEKIETRLVSQYQHLLAFVCGHIWLLRTKTTCDIDDKIKKMRMEVGAFDYSVKEQAEFLTRLLCELDCILSYGNIQVKDKRKALVVYIQKLLPIADQLKKKSQQLKNFNERLLRNLSTSSKSNTLTSSSSMDMEVDEDQVMTSTEPHEKEYGEQLPEQEEHEEQEEQDLDQDDDEEEEEEEEEEEQEEEQYLEQAKEDEKVQEDKTRLLRSLPVWKPYYQIHKRSDGVYLTVNLRNVDPQNIRVQANTSTGVLKISGFKLPTQKDFVMTRVQGVPTFGRFEIIERLPTHLVNLERASQEMLANGLLEIHLPFYMIQHPRLFRPPHPMFEPRRCVVW
jgi:hypothetical protein